VEEGFEIRTKSHPESFHPLTKPCSFVKLLFRFLKCFGSIQLSNAGHTCPHYFFNSNLGEDSDRWRAKDLHGKHPNEKSEKRRSWPQRIERPSKIFLPFPPPKNPKGSEGRRAVLEGNSRELME
jgi:hypothetical protein